MHLATDRSQARRVTLADPLQTLALRRPGSAVARAADTRRGPELGVLSPESPKGDSPPQAHGSGGTAVAFRPTGLILSDNRKVVCRAEASPGRRRGTSQDPENPLPS